jgi:Bifunctional DNA primase/polymerase, N-terminal
MALKLSTNLEATVIPIGENKATKVKGWQRLTVQESVSKKAIQLFTDKTKGIGIVLGKASTGLCSIDCDSEEALAEFLEANPSFRYSFISRGARGANVWVRIIGPCPQLKPLLKNGLPWGDWRADGGYTIV